MADIPTIQIPGVYHRKIGDIVVTALSDGYLDGSMEVLRNITPEQSIELLKENFRPVPRRTSVNCFAIHSAGRLALIETGSGNYMGPTVGWLQRNLKAAGIDYKVGKFPFTANGRAKAMLATQGFVKILADVETDQVLGAHIIGHAASEMIEALTLLMEFGGSAEDLARTTAAHPTLSEAIREAALMCGDGAIHI